MNNNIAGLENKFKWKAIVSKCYVLNLWEFTLLFGAIVCVTLVFHQKGNFYAAFSR